MGFKKALVVCFLVANCIAEEIVLKTDKGNIRGIRVDTDAGLYYYSFRGIRYAQPPIESLRFKVKHFVISYYSDDHIAHQYFSFRILLKLNLTLRNMMPLMMVWFALNSRSVPEVPLVMKIV